MNLQKRILNYEEYFERGKIYLNNKKFRKAKLDFSEYINRSESKDYFNCRQLVLDEFISQDAHFFRAIANFYLGDLYDQNGFYIDTQYLESLKLLRSANYFFNPLSLSFLKVLWTIKNGNHLTSYDSAINIISKCIASNPEALDYFTEFQIHFPLEFQVIFKMYFY